MVAPRRCSGRPRSCQGVDGRSCEHLGASGRSDFNLAVASMLDKASERPLEQVVSGRRSREAKTTELLEIGERHQIYIGVARVEASRRLHLFLAERRHGIRESRIAAKQLGAPVRDVESGLRPMERPVQRWEAI